MYPIDIESIGVLYFSLFLQTGSVQESDTVHLMKEMKFLAFKHKLRSVHHQNHCNGIGSKIELPVCCLSCPTLSIFFIPDGTKKTEFKRVEISIMQAIIYENFGAILLHSILNT